MDDSIEDRPARPGAETSANAGPDAQLGELFELVWASETATRQDNRVEAAAEFGRD